MHNKVVKLLLLFVLFTLITGCKKPIEPDLKRSDFVPTNVKNVSISISNISLTGATIYIKDTNEKPYMYSEWYKLEKEENGKWYEVETKIKDYDFNEIEYKVDKNKEVRFIINWKELYRELPLGFYRIIKQVNNQNISIQFGIARA